MQSTLIAGDTINYAAAVTGYSPADGWSLRYRLTPRAGGGAAIDITAIADAGGWLVQVSPTTTAAWAPGEYTWASWMQRTGERYSIGQGQCTIKADPATMAVGTDTRTPAAILLATLEAAYLAHIQSGNAVVGYYLINGRQMQYRKFEELLAAIASARRQVESEKVAARVAAGFSPRQRFVVRM